MKQLSTRKSSIRRSQNIWYVFLIPTLCGILFFMLYPILESFRLSFFQSNGTIETFRGLDNYRHVLTNDAFRKAIFNTFFITFFQLLIVIPVGFLVALSINSIARGKNILKSLFFIPYITPAIAAGTLFLYVLHPQGILNQFLGWFGVEPIAWLQAATSARFGAVLMCAWKMLGFNVIIFLAYLQAISPEYYEAAYIDGCSRLQSHLYITIPHMKGAFGFLITMGWIQGMQRFTEVYALGGITGSPSRSLLTIVGFIYERGFGNFEFGVAAAASWVLFIIIMLFTLLNARLTKLDL